MLGLIGKKLGMSQIQVNGQMIPVTLVEVMPNQVVSMNEEATTILLGYGAKKHPNKPEQGKFKGKDVPRTYHQFAVGEEIADLKDKESLDISVFEPDQAIKVIGTSKGKGFAGTIKRHNFARGPMGHGHDHHRQPGSIGDMGRPNVIKGRRMAGQMGNTQVTTRNLKIVAVDTKNNQLLVKGAVPGYAGNYVILEKI